MLDRIMQREAEYACFNRKRSLSRIDEGTAEIMRLDMGLAIHDSSYPDNTYFNRHCILESKVSAFDAASEIQRIDLFSPISASEDSAPLAGFERQYTVTFYERDLKSTIVSNNRTSDVRVDLCHDPDVFISVIGQSIGREIGKDVRTAKRSHYCSNEFKCYTALIDDQVAGIATFYVIDRVAWLANAFTFEAYRNRGVQSALLQRRLDDSRLLGLSTAITDVEPGTTSERNVERFGFKPIAYASVWEWACP